MISNIEKTCIMFVFSLSILPFVANGQTLISVMKENQETVAFARALEGTGLDQELEEAGPFTIFAPSSDAMKDIPGGLNVNSSGTRALLLNHIMTGLATERSIRIMTKATSLGGFTLKISKQGDDIYINRARLVQSNIRAGNGVIHIIDQVLK